MRNNIAIVGMGCCYPDARTPGELWENVLAQRQAFRRMPDCRLRLQDYHSGNRQAPDRTYAEQAAVLEGYEFDRVQFRVAGSSYRTADLSHWLALDVASQALSDAGFPEGEGLPRDATGVLLGNSLTGEFSRAHLMRLRWPYVRRTTAAALLEEGWDEERCERFLELLEQRYKAPFPDLTEESLAGGLSNTIAGRISNHFDLHGGGYTVDGACASSLLAVAGACTALAAGEMDVALTGGVDLSLDPFELVGFAKTGALAQGPMRVFDAASDGFIPGEGCGFVVLMRERQARAECRQIYAVIRGWGISSDGSGGLTRPEASGQRLALERAYRRAGFGIDTVGLFEGHGTGTAVGDATELATLIELRRASGARIAAALGSIKSNIGHTKAAAGVAGLIKAVQAVRHRLLPPHTGWQTPHPSLCAGSPVLRLLRRPEPWPDGQPLRAAVSAMGFGGINAHLLLEGNSSPSRIGRVRFERLSRSNQDAEAFLFAASDAEQLSRRLEKVQAYARQISQSQLTDLAAQLQRQLQPGRVRAALTASSPSELSERLHSLIALLRRGQESHLDAGSGVFLGSSTRSPRIGFLFSGQGAPCRSSGGAWRRRFGSLEDLYRNRASEDEDSVATEIAQPSIVAASLAGLRMLGELGLEACIAIGHSLGELSALHWAGAMDEKPLLRIAAQRGQAMARLRGPEGGMVSLGAAPSAIEELLDGLPLQVASFNAPEDTVVSGPLGSCLELIERAHTAGLRATRLRVSHAFHSPLVAAAAPQLAKCLSKTRLRSLERRVVSTVTGSPLTADADLASILVEQVTSPVRFVQAVSQAGQDLDLWIEVGPGGLLAGLVQRFQSVPSIALDVGGESLKGLLQAVAAAFALGAPVRTAALFEDRLSRPFDLDWQPRFLTNPCEEAPQVFEQKVREEEIQPAEEASPFVEGEETASTRDLLRRLIAQRAELPLQAVRDESLLLSDLHLNSISVSELVSAAARRMHIDPPAAPNEYANATVAQVAQALDELHASGGGRSRGEDGGTVIEGVDAWVRPFRVQLVEKPLASVAPALDSQEPLRFQWQVLASPRHPLFERLKEALQQVGPAGRLAAGVGRGVALCLPPQAGPDQAGLLLDAAQAVIRSKQPPSVFVLLQEDGGGGGFARTLHLESSGLDSIVLDLPFDHPRAIEWIVEEVRAAAGYVEAHYDSQGCRRVPRLKLLDVPFEEPSGQAAEALVGHRDVLLVSGGGKGIAAECALRLARRRGVRLLLLGRSDPAADSELSGNLRRFEAYQVEHVYLQADVTDRTSVRNALREGQSRLGTVTALLHGAGYNQPRPLSLLSREDFERTLAPKLGGLENLLAEIDPDRLRLLVTFGSIIARSGMPGEADYAAANEWLARRTEGHGIDHPHCRCLCLEWSVWSGIGMGERLGRLDALIREGITPIPPEEGARWLERLLGVSRRELDSTSVVVTGRFGEMPTLRQDQPDLPLQRFLEHPRVYVPGVELVVDSDLSSESDPYLSEHALRGERLFPAVMGLEAMAQASLAAIGCPAARSSLVFEKVAFHRPVVVSPGEKVRVRIGVVVRGRDRVEAVLRSQSTAFKVDHFQAVCRLGKSPQGTCQAPEIFAPPNGVGPIPLDPHADLYENILFHQGRFRRLKQYWTLRATECTAEIAPDGAKEWFGHYLSRELVLGDPGARDAAIHAIQACIPHATILPLGVDRIEVGLLDSRAVFMSARERSRDGDTLVYDLEVVDLEGRVVERWTGLKLRIVHRIQPASDWAVPLLGAHFERRLQELIPGSDVQVVLEKAQGERPQRTDHAVSQLANGSGSLLRRPDGKPELTNGRSISVSHAGDLILAVSAAGQVGCDLEPVSGRTSQSWTDLLGADRYRLSQLISETSREDIQASATRIWAAAESLKKAGALAASPLTFKEATPDGWVLLGSGRSRIGTLVAHIRHDEHPLALTVVFGDAEEPFSRRNAKEPR